MDYDILATVRGVEIETHKRSKTTLFIMTKHIFDRFVIINSVPGFLTFFLCLGLVLERLKSFLFKILFCHFNKKAHTPKVCTYFVLSY